MAMAGFRLVIFDLDGTLIDSRPDIAAALNLALGDHGLPAWSEPEIEVMIGDGARNLVERAMAGRQPSDRVDAVLARYQVHYAAHRAVRTRLYPGVLECLVALDASPRVARAIATNKPGALARAIASDLGLASRVDLILGDGDVAHRKPDPDMLEVAMERLGADRSSTLYIGDGPVDVRAASNAGVALCLVGWGYRREETEGAAADYRVERFAEVEEIVRRGRAML